MRQRTRAASTCRPQAPRVLGGRLAEAERHLEQGVALAQRLGRPFLEFSGLAYQAAVQIYLSWSFPRSTVERSRQAVELARRHGWTDEPAAGIAYAVLAT